MDVQAAERPEIPHAHPVESAPPTRDISISRIFNDIIARNFTIEPSNEYRWPEGADIRQAFDDIVKRNFGPESKVRSHLSDVQKASDIGRLAMVKWQNRKASMDHENSWINRKPWLRRTLTFLGSTAAVGTVWTLASRTSQAYAMTRHGMDLNLDVTHASPSITDSGHDSTVIHEASRPAASESMTLAAYQSADGTHDNGVHYYGGVRVEDADYLGKHRVAESWSSEKECVTVWSRQDLAEAGHRAGLDDSQIRNVAHNEQAITELTNHYIKTNSAIGNDPNHWLYEGQTYNTEAAHAKADAIIREHFPNAGKPHHEHPPTEPGTKPNPDTHNPTNDPDLKDAADDAKAHAEKADNFIEGYWNNFVSYVERESKEAWDEWWESKWLRLIVGLGTLAAYAGHEARNRRRPRRPRPLTPLYTDPLAPPYARHSSVPPLTNEGRARKGLSGLKERIATSGWATRASERWSERSATPASPRPKDPVSKP